MRESPGFAVVGARHAHALSLIDALQAAGARARIVFEESDAHAQAACAAARAPRARCVAEALDCTGADFVLCGGIPSMRAAAAEQAMRAGRDVLCVKPGCLSLDELTALKCAHEQTGRMFVVWFSERLASRSTLAAIEFAQRGVIGQLMHVTGFGPHRLSPPEREPWFFDTLKAGGIIADLGAHQIDQFLTLCGSLDAQIMHAAVRESGNGLQVHGEAALRAGRTTGFFRVDWLIPQRFPSWGDPRLFIVGERGFIEVRKILDFGASGDGEIVIIADQTRVRRIDARGHELPFISSFLKDVRERTQRAAPQPHVFKVCELAILAQNAAVRL